MLLKFSLAPPPKPPCAILRRQIPLFQSNLSTQTSKIHETNRNLNHRELVNFPPFSHNLNSVKPLTTVVKSSLFSSPIISANDSWGTWTALFVSAAFGFWSEKTKIGNALSGPLVATLVGLVASNLGIIASEAKAYSVVLEFLLPLAVPLLLYRADIRRVIQSTGKLLFAFLIGSGLRNHRSRIYWLPKTGVRVSSTEMLAYLS